MTNEQALSILQQIAEQANMPLQAHQQAQQAISILRALIQPVDGLHLNNE